MAIYSQMKEQNKVIINKYFKLYICFFIRIGEIIFKHAKTINGANKSFK